MGDRLCVWTLDVDVYKRGAGTNLFTLLLLLLLFAALGYFLRTARSFRWVPMCCPSTNCNRPGSTNGPFCTIRPSKPFGTGSCSFSSSTRPSLRLTLPLSSSTSTTLAARRVNAMETIPSSSSIYSVNIFVCGTPPTSARDLNAPCFALSL